MGVSSPSSMAFVEAEDNTGDEVVVVGVVKGGVNCVTESLLGVHELVVGIVQGHRLSRVAIPSIGNNWCG